MTCSPDGSMFMNVTNAIRTVDFPNVWSIESMSVFVDPQFGEEFFDSCKDVTFSQSNQPAMNFIGGGATNYLDFLAYLGQKSIIGSPFQINFPAPPFEPAYMPMNGTMIACSDLGPYQCACVDCLPRCPPVPEPEEEGEPCYVGKMRCLSFTLLMVFSAALLVIVIALLILRWRTSDYLVLSETNNSINQDAPPLPKEWFIYSFLQRYVALAAEARAPKRAGRMQLTFFGARRLPRVPPSPAAPTTRWACGSPTTRPWLCCVAQSLSQASRSASSTSRS